MVTMINRQPSKAGRMGLALGDALGKMSVSFQEMARHKDQMEQKQRYTSYLEQKQQADEKANRQTYLSDMAFNSLDTKKFKLVQGQQRYRFTPEEIQSTLSADQLYTTGQYLSMSKSEVPEIRQKGAEGLGLSGVDASGGTPPSDSEKRLSRAAWLKEIEGWSGSRITANEKKRKELRTKGNPVYTYLDKEGAPVWPAAGTGFTHRTNAIGQVRKFTNKDYQSLLNLNEDDKLTRKMKRLFMSKIKDGVTKQEVLRAGGIHAWPGWSKIKSTKEFNAAVRNQLQVQSGEMSPFIKNKQEMPLVRDEADAVAGNPMGGEYQKMDFYLSATPELRADIDYLVQKGESIDSIKKELKKKPGVK